MGDQWSEESGVHGVRSASHGNWKILSRIHDAGLEVVQWRGTGKDAQLLWSRSDLLARNPVASARRTSVSAWMRARANGKWSNRLPAAIGSRRHTARGRLATLCPSCRQAPAVRDMQCSRGKVNSWRATATPRSRCWRGHPRRPAAVKHFPRVPASWISRSVRRDSCRASQDRRRRIPGCGRCTGGGVVLSDRAPASPCSRSWSTP